MSGKTGIVLITSILAGCLVFAVAFYLGQKSNAKPTEFYPPSTVSTKPGILTPTVTPNVTQNLNGVVEGSLSYPSEGIPSDLKVCAETTDGELVKCTEERIADKKYQYGVGYRLELPEGKYYIYATTNEGLRNKAYYTEYVTCGLLYSCPSHQKIEVQVSVGQTKTGIDPGDWYIN